MVRNLRAYLDACALNRLFDDNAQSRVRLEAEATEIILALNSLGAIKWIASSALRAELDRNERAEQRARALDLLSQAQEYIRPDRHCYERAAKLIEAGYGVYDALHLACAERAAANVFLTTDDRLLRKAAKGLGNLRIRTMNPVDWIKEIRR
jgi:predicted nucleic acid-binding protein